MVLMDLDVAIIEIGFVKTWLIKYAAAKERSKRVLDTNVCVCLFSLQIQVFIPSVSLYRNNNLHPICAFLQ